MDVIIIYLKNVNLISNTPFVTETFIQDNYQYIQDTKHFLKDNIENFKEYIKGKYNPVQEAIVNANIEELLFQGADYLIDENIKNSIDNNTKSTPFPKEQLLQDVKEFLLAQSEGLYFTDVYKEGMNSQPYFTSTQEQYKDSNWDTNTEKIL